MSTKPPAFLSYARVDLAFARRLAADLKAAGANVWLDKADIRPGSQWDREVEKALTACTEVLVILSPASVESTNVMDEVAFALEEGKTVIPVIQSECRIPFRLRRLQHIDFCSGYEPALKDLLEVLVVEDQVAPRSQGAAAPTREEESDPEDEPRVYPITLPSIRAHPSYRAGPVLKIGKTPAPDASSSEVSLFPLYGITLGVTTKSELAKLGQRATLIDKNTGKPYLYYVYKGIDFWYDEESNLADSIYLTYADPVPGPWQTLGFSWEKSYDQWLSWLKEIGYSIEIEEKPHIEPYDGHDSFSAKFIARTDLPHPHRVELTFQFSEGTKTDSTGTLYSMDVAADGD